MANLHRGEIDAEIGGRRHRLRLTLGALAELEAACGVDDLNQLVERFATGRISARDLTRIIAAGLRGAGTEVDETEVARMPIEGGAVAYAELAARLLEATFGTARAGAGEPG